MVQIMSFNPFPNEEYDISYSLNGKSSSGLIKFEDTYFRIISNERQFSSSYTLIRAVTCQRISLGNEIHISFKNFNFLKFFKMTEEKSRTLFSAFENRFLNRTTS